MGGISNGDDDFRFHGELTNCNGDIKYIWINLITTSLTICHNAKWWLGSGGMISNWHLRLENYDIFQPEGI